ncbi:MAG: PEP-CTERM sorting domain-containing protein [Gammaproteobacteria bacterium]
MKGFGKILLSGLLLVSTSSFAASLSLSPSTGSIVENSSYTVDLVFNNDAPSLPAGSFISGILKLDYSNNVTFDSTTLGSVTSTPGLLTIDLFDHEISDTTLGSFTFTANATGWADFFLTDKNSQGSFSYSDSPSGSNGFAPTLIGAEVLVTAVPVPAAAWLMLSGLGLLGSLNFRRK